MYDWLYNISGICNDTALPNSYWDNDVTSPESSFLLTLLFISACIAMLAAGSPRRRARGLSMEYDFGVHLMTGPDVGRALSRPNESATNLVGSFLEIVQRPPKERMWHLDFARIVCVSCVVTEHSGGSTYSEHDTFFALQWVLPYLFLTSGICFMLSSAPIWFYTSRLTMVFIVGVGLNWFADAKTGRDWQHDFGSTVFQMFYVVFLIALAFIGGPLRRALKWRFANPDAPNNSKLRGVAVGHGLLALFGYGMLLAGKPIIPMAQPEDPLSWAARAKIMFDNSSVIAAGTGGCFFLAALACMVNASPWHAWILLAAIYVPRVFCPFAYAGFSHNVDLYLFGMVCAKWGIAGKEAIADAVRAYWPLMLAVMGLMLTPDLTGRCDLNPPQTAWLRFRFYFIEFILTVCFVTGAFNTSDPWKWTGWLNKWALFAYVSHVAWYRLFPVPCGALLTYGSLLPFWLMHKAKQRNLENDADSVSLSAVHEEDDGNHNHSSLTLVEAGNGVSLQRTVGRELREPVAADGAAGPSQSSPASMTPGMSFPAVGFSDSSKPATAGAAAVPLVPLTEADASDDAAARGKV